MICYNSLFDEKESPFVPDCCDDIYHLKCLRDHVLSSIDSQKFPIKCPNADCKKDFTDKILEKVLKPDEFKKFNRFMVKWTRTKLAQTTDCPNPDCTYFFEREGERYYKCVACQKAYCLECNVPYHEKMTCEEYKYHKDPAK